jgi:hypothetical protein
MTLINHLDARGRYAVSVHQNEFRHLDDTVYEAPFKFETLQRG